MKKFPWLFTVILFVLFSLTYFFTLFNDRGEWLFDPIFRPLIDNAPEIVAVVILAPIVFTIEAVKFIPNTITESLFFDNYCGISMDIRGGESYHFCFGEKINDMFIFKYYLLASLLSALALGLLLYLGKKVYAKAKAKKNS